MLEVKAQAENTKKSFSWSRETVRARSESLMLTSILLLNELHVYPASRVSFDLPRKIGKRKETLQRPRLSLICRSSKEMDESVQFRGGQTGFHCCAWSLFKESLPFPRPRYVVYKSIRSTNTAAASLSYKVFEKAANSALVKVKIGHISSLTEPQKRSLFSFLCGNDTLLCLPAGHGKSTLRPQGLHTRQELALQSIVSKMNSSF